MKEYNILRALCVLAEFGAIACAITCCFTQEWQGATVFMLLAIYASIKKYDIE